MVGSFYMSESTVEALFPRNCSDIPFLLFGSFVLPKRIAFVPSRKRVAVRSSLDGTGVNVLSKEFEFKPSFVEYLKELESVKVDRDKVGDTVNVRSKTREKRGGVHEVSSVRETASKGGFVKRKVLPNERNEEVTSVIKVVSKEGYVKRRVMPNEDSLYHESATEEVKKKRNGVIKKFDGKREHDDAIWERAAFRSMESEDDVVGKKRVSRADKEDRIQKLAKCINGADIDMPEWQFSKMMRSAQIKYTDYSIMRLVQTLGMLGNWRRVLQVIDWMRSHERFKSHKLRYVYTAALTALGKARRPVESLNLFRAMLEQMSSYPDIVAYHCIAVTLGQAGHIKELFDVIDTMRAPPKKKFNTPFLDKWDPRLEPDITVYNAVLNACVQRKNWEGAFWVLQQLREKGQQPSCATYGLVMEVMLACDKYNLVHDFFKKVQKSYIPNALIYRVLVNTLWKEGKIDEVTRAVDEMERRGIVGNAALYYDLARCLCSAGRCEDALKQLNKLCRVANKPLVVTYTGLIQACLDAGYVENGAYIFSHMQKFCSPNLVTCNIMLKGFVDHRRYQDAFELFLKLLENSGSICGDSDYKGRVIPDIYTFNAMLDACFAEKQWDDLEFAYAQMLEYGHHFNVKRHLRLVLDSCRAGRDKLLEMVWNHLVKVGRLPPTPLVIELLRKKLDNDNATAALSCLVESHSEDSSALTQKSWSNFFVENGSRFKEATLNELIRKGSCSEKVAVKHLIESCKEFLQNRRTSSWGKTRFKETGVFV